MYKSKISLISLLVFTFLINVSVFAQTLVTNQTELDAAINSARESSQIVMKNGVWNDVTIDIYAAGSADFPIVIRAEEVGEVFLEGNSRVQLGGRYIRFEGVVFQNPSGLELNGTTIDPIIEFRDSDQNECKNCTVSNIKIDSYNGTEAQKTAVFKWIVLYGTGNTIKYSSFVGKYGVGSIINDNRNNTAVNYHQIHHNYFADRTPINDFNEDNDQDAIRLGNSSTSLSDSYTEVYDNYFNNWSGEIEIISNKSGSNKYYNNTFRDYQGALTLRHGDNCEVYNNYFFANNNFNSAGIRVIGEGHKVYNNYIEGINSIKEGGSLSGATGGINITNGRENTALNGYYQVKDAQIVNNTFVNCDYAIRVGTMVSSDLFLAPENIEVSNNIMLTSSVEAIDITTPPIGTSAYHNNITKDGDWEITTDVNGNIETDLTLLTKSENDEFYKLVTGSPAIDYGTAFDFVTFDVTGDTRGEKIDAGAQELNSTGDNQPYTDDHIGVSVGFATAEIIDPYPLPLSTTERTFNTNLIIYPNPANQGILNLESEKIIGDYYLHDLAGKTILKGSTLGNKLSIEVGQLYTGYYVLVIPQIGKTKVLIQNN